MKEVPDVMRRATARVDELLSAGRVPLEVDLAMRALALAGNDHVAECRRCRVALQRAGRGRVPDRADLCAELVALFEGLGQLGSLVVNPDTAELGPFARRVES